MCSLVSCSGARAISREQKVLSRQCWTYVGARKAARIANYALSGGKQLICGHERIKDNGNSTKSV